MMTITKISENSYKFIDGENEATLTKISLEKKTGKYWLHLPYPNSMNRKLICLDKFNDNDTVTIEDAKSSPTRNPDSPKKIPTNSLIEYLTDEEKKIYEELIQKAQKRKALADARKEIEHWENEVKRLEEEA